MNDMIEITMQTPIEIALGIDENGMTTAKKLFDFLGMAKNNYSRWFRNNLINNEFAEENIDLAFYKHPLNMTVKMSGKLESIAEWLKNNTTYFGVYNYIRVQDPIDSDGYFGNSSFDIVWNFSSLNYGWMTLRSDNPKSIIFGRLLYGEAEWDIPVFKSI